MQYFTVLHTVQYSTVFSTAHCTVQYSDHQWDPRLSSPWAPVSPLSGYFLSSVQMYNFTNAKMCKCTTVQRYNCTTVHCKLYKCTTLKSTNLHMHNCTIVQLYTLYYIMLCRMLGPWEKMSL